MSSHVHDLKVVLDIVVASRTAELKYSVKKVQSVRITEVLQISS